jgi:hypothetical protein
MTLPTWLADLLPASVVTALEAGLKALGVAGLSGLVGGLLGSKLAGWLFKEAGTERPPWYLRAFVAAILGGIIAAILATILAALLIALGLLTVGSGGVAGIAIVAAAIGAVVAALDSYRQS